MRQAALLVALFALLVTPVAVADAQSDAADRQVVMEISLEDDGDARWNVSVQFSLDSRNETQAFQRLATEFERGAGTSGTGFSVRVFERAAQRVSDQTGRPMQIQSVDRTAYVTNGSRTGGLANGSKTGVLTLQFTWTNFGQTGNKTVSIQQAFVGSWFGDLGERQTLVIQPPPGYQVDTAQPSFDIINGSLRWQGPQTFESGQPSVRFVETTEPITTPPGGSWVVTAFAALVALIVGAGAVYVWVDQRRSRRGEKTAERAPSHVEETAAGAEGGREGVEPAPEETEPTTAEEATEEATEETEKPETAAEEATGAGAGTEETEPELLSDEERVERLLREHGGRMKQAKIVEETRWSNAKVSQLLSSMDEEGRIEKLRIGRENLISLPEYGEGDENGDGSEDSAGNNSDE